MFASRIAIVTVTAVFFLHHPRRCDSSDSDSAELSESLISKVNETDVSNFARRRTKIKGRTKKGRPTRRNPPDFKAPTLPNAPGKPNTGKDSGTNDKKRNVAGDANDNFMKGFNVGNVFKSMGAHSIGNWLLKSNFRI